MNSITLTAPAKVNLVLRVLGKRPDGYHDLHTLFERIDLSDRITITKAPSGIRVACDRPVTSRQRDNIAYKAAEAMLGHARVKAGVNIRIQKRIPVAAGLGGGSSDAAAVLIGINRLFGLNINKSAMRRIGARLGADVPFFLLDAPFAIGEGIGDRLRTREKGPKLWHVLIFPGCGAATKRVYAAFDRSRRGRSSSLTRPSGSVTMAFPRDLDGARRMLCNDLEETAIEQRPVVGKIMQCLVHSLGKGGIVSGSGPSVFCLYGSRKEAARAKDRLFRCVPARMRKRWQVFIVGTL